uniref:Replication factor A C-terminal domain-containing protein n=1 Tax=Brassica oleracea TaxID=3712 RepID=A0A3P6F150_BRAOL|nr:unnamed protein product [Brassica oleracea]
MAILSVLDDTGTSAFLGFDTKVTKLTGIEASEAAQIVVDTDLPRSLADIVGSTYTFQLRLKGFNFLCKPPNLYRVPHISRRACTYANLSCEYYCDRDRMRTC